MASLERLPGTRLDTTRGLGNSRMQCNCRLLQVSEGLLLREYQLKEATRNSRNHQREHSRTATVLTRAQMLTIVWYMNEEVVLVTIAEL